MGMKKTLASSWKRRVIQANRQKNNWTEQKVKVAKVFPAVRVVTAEPLDDTSTQAPPVVDNRQQEVDNLVSLPEAPAPAAPRGRGRPKKVFDPNAPNPNNRGITEPVAKQVAKEVIRSIGIGREFADEVLQNMNILRSEKAIPKDIYIEIKRIETFAKDAIMKLAGLVHSENTPYNKELPAFPNMKEENKFYDQDNPGTYKGLVLRARSYWYEMKQRLTYLRELLLKYNYERFIPLDKLDQWEQDEAKFEQMVPWWAEGQYDYFMEATLNQPGGSGWGGKNKARMHQERQNTNGRNPYADLGDGGVDDTFFSRDSDPTSHQADLFGDIDLSDVDMEEDEEGEDVEEGKAMQYEDYIARVLQEAVKEKPVVWNQFRNPPYTIPPFKDRMRASKVVPKQLDALANMVQMNLDFGGIQVPTQLIRGAMDKAFAHMNLETYNDFMQKLKSRDGADFAKGMYHFLSQSF